jgi:cell division septation protein DedD
MKTPTAALALTALLLAGGAACSDSEPDEPSAASSTTSTSAASTTSTAEKFIRLQATNGDAAFTEAKAHPKWNPNTAVIYQDGSTFWLQLNGFADDPPKGWKVVDTDCLPSTYTAALC